MSGRSAYVRKKITDTKQKSVSSRGRAKSAGSSEHDDLAYSDFPMPQGPMGTGVGTTNARFLKFSEPPRDMTADPIASLRNVSTPSIGSQSGGSSSDGRRDGIVVPNYGAGIEDYHSYSRAARRPTLKTDEVSGIEKSGLRSMLDKKSEDVRKGLAKTFTFRKKDKDGVRWVGDRLSEYRPESAATVRQAAYPPPEAAHGYEPYAEHAHAHAPRQPPDPWEGTPFVSPPPSAKLPPVPQVATTPPIRRWVGFSRPVQRWNKLRKDPELWDPNGDVLVFFGHKGQSPRPNPSFRLSSHIIEATESRYLLTLLREGSTEEDFAMSPSLAGAPPMLRGHGQGHMLGHGFARGGQPTPPVSEDASLGEADGQISYEMYFPTPFNLSKVDQLRHHITTRNVFAMLYHASLVGISLYQALSDLHTRLEAYMPPESDNVGKIIEYIQARGIDDVRNDAETAVSLLAWSEGSEVRWDEGWCESFVHCAGMYGQLERSVDFKSTSQFSRALLDRAWLETQVRVHHAEERLVEFQYSDMWPPSGPPSSSPARAAADRLQKFLLAHYSRVFGYWPPRTQGQQSMSSAPPSPVDSEHENEEIWLTRTITQALQKDFGALYDYLVNRDVIWDGSETRAGRKWIMTSESGNKSFEADVPDVPMTDMLIEFDNKQRYPHIPHPYPLVPESIPPISSTGGKEGGLFKSSSKKNGHSSGSGTNPARVGNIERRVRLAYTESTNISILGADFAQSDLVDAFVKFERQDRICEVDPALARCGRWVLIYGVLQTLASVSVDSPTTRYRDDVPYHISPRLKGTKLPPWRGGHHNPGDPDEACHELSHCWLVPRSWNATTPHHSSGAESSGGSGNTSPVVGVRGPRMQGWPRPPPSIASTTRTSVAGYHTPGTRSVRSSASIPPFSRAASVISESDAASSIRTPASGRPPGRARSRDDVKALNSAAGSLRSAGSYGIGMGSFDRVEEDYPSYVQKRDFAAPMPMPTPPTMPVPTSHTPPNDASSAYGAYGHSSASVPPGPPPTQALPVPGGIAGSGGFLILDDTGDSRSSSFTTGSGGRNRPLLSGRDSDSDGVTAVIKDFDELGVIDDAEP